MVRYLLALLVLSSTVEGLSSSTASSKNEAFVPEGLSSTSSNEEYRYSNDTFYKLKRLTIAQCPNKFLFYIIHVLTVGFNHQPK